MANKPIKQRVDVEGNAVENLKKVSAEEKKLAREVKDTGKASKDASRDHDEAGMSLDRMRESARGLISTFVGAAGLQQAIQAIRSEMQAFVQDTEAVVEASLNLQFLDQEFDPQQREFVGKAAAFAGRSVTETARAFGELRSRLPQLDKQQQQQLFLQVAESGLTTEAPLQSLVNAFATIQQFEKDPQKAQNILREAINQAGVSDPGKLSPLFAKFLGVGTGLGGLDAGEAAGVAAAATGLGLNPEEAITGIKNVTLSLRGKGTPAGRGILDAAGIAQDAPLLQQLQSLSAAVQSGQITEAQLEEIGGREAVGVFSSLVDPQQLKDFLAKVRSVDAAQDTDRDLTAEVIQNQVKDDERLRLSINLRQERARLEAARATSERSLDAMRSELGKVTFERAQFEEGVGTIGRGASGFVFDTATFLGFDPITASRLGEFGTSPATEAVEQNIQRSGTGNLIINYGRINQGQEYNTVNPDGTTHQTESTGRSDLP